MTSVIYGITGYNDMAYAKKMYVVQKLKGGSYI